MLRVLAIEPTVFAMQGGATISSPDNHLPANESSVGTWESIALVNMVFYTVGRYNSRAPGTVFNLRLSPNILTLLWINFA